MADKQQASRDVIQIAKEVSEVADNVVPRILVKLQKVLDAYPPGSKMHSKVKVDIWSLGLIKVALTALKQDFGKILNGWELAYKVANIVSCRLWTALTNKGEKYKVSHEEGKTNKEFHFASFYNHSQTCSGLELPSTERFYSDSVPDIVQTLLIVARKIQVKFIKTSDILEDTKKDLMSYFKGVLDGISLFCSGPEKIGLEALKSPWLLQMVLTDDGRSFIQVTELVQSINRMKPGIFGKVEEKLQHQYLDELVYKLSTSSEGGVAGAACRTINTFCESYSPTVELLCKRYRGLLPLLLTWKNRGFERDLDRLQKLLDAGSMRQAELQSKHEAAILIQACWRSYHTRQKVQKANVAIATFQRSFRARRRQKEEEKEMARIRSDLEHMLQMNRLKAMRELRTRKLHALQILPADEIEKYLQQESHNAAIQIQRHWRGYKIRKDIIQEKRIYVMQTKAAIKIQRMVRKWLEHKQAHRQEPWQRPQGLTDERRFQLQEKITEWRQNHEIQTKTEEAREKLHYTVQAVIKQFAMKRRFSWKNQQRRELLLSRIAMDAEMLLEAPKLPEAVEADIEDFRSHSVPIATKARYNHAQELRLLRQPWWKKLGDEYQDKMYEEESESWKIF